MPRYTFLSPSNSQDRERHPNALTRSTMVNTGRHKLQVLHILSENLNNPQPGLVRSGDIATRLQLSLPETKLLLQLMNDMGVIESDADKQLSLITREGLQYLHMNSHLDA